ncbi:MAG: diguanylate cyclase domain-containing protein, partial [Pseudomonadota bacterium]
MGKKQKSYFRLLIIALIASQVIAIFYQYFFSNSINTRLREEIESQARESSYRIVHLAYNSVLHIIEDQRAGLLSKEQARQSICEVIKKFVYTDENGQNYVFMSSYDGIMLVQPFEPEKVGSNQLELKDADGKYIIRELIAAAKKYPEGSYVTYSFYPPNRTVPEEKLSYVMGIPEIDAYIGTGMYAAYSLNKLKKILGDQANGYLFINTFVIFSFLLFIATLYQSRKNLKSSFKALQTARNELQLNHDELSALYEELTATEEELRHQYDELLFSEHERQVLMDRYQLVADGASDIIWDLDIRSGKLFISDRFSEILGYEKDEISVNTIEDFWKFVHPDDKKAINEKVLIFTDNKPDHIMSEYRMFRKDGSYGWFRARRKIIYDENGNVIRNAGSITDITQNKQYEEEIERMAYYDYLTGLPNRRSLADELKANIEKSIENGSSGSVTYIDLDNFKIINDTFGHSYGDEVLLRITEKLKQFSSENIRVYRIGGDEFILVNNNCEGASSSAMLAEAILSSFADPVAVDDNSFKITCSIGIAQYPKDGSNVGDILKNADLAMYKGKSSGKSKFVFYEPSIGSELSARIKLESDLKEAYENKEFELHYQPQVCTGSKALTGFEALLRWNSPKYGQVSPGIFIPVAEETGLINDIGRLVIDYSFAFARSLQGQGVCVSCNVSPVQLIQSDFVDAVIGMYDK